MRFSLDLLKAHQGDCYLIHFGTENEPGLVMVDGGPKQVYKPYLKKRLLKIKEARSLDQNQSLPVDLLMISHVDSDHIQGILDLTKKEIEAKKDHQAQLLNVQRFWHNSFKEILAQDPDDLTLAMKRHFGEAAVSQGELTDAAKDEVEEDCQEDPEVIASSLKVLASIGQGISLVSNAEGLGYPRNEGFAKKVVMAIQNAPAKFIAPGLKLTVVGPMDPELKALREKHRKWLEEHKDKPVTQALAAYVDKSVPNLSSIVVLAEVEEERPYRMLLTGDARGDKILEGLQLTGVLAPGQTSSIEVDVLKVPHHGSANNLAQDFFERIIAKHYVFSGDGEYGNPERETLEMLYKARGQADYKIHLTYSIPDIDKKREEDWKKQQDKERKLKAKHPDKEVREDWLPAKHRLTAFFEAHQDIAKKISIVEEGKPHVIDLLEKIGF